MFCRCDQVQRVLREFIRYPDICQFKKIVDLTWMACIVSEFSFQSRDETRDEFKEMLFAIITERSRLRMKDKKRHIPVNFDSVSPFLCSDHELEKGDLSVISNMYHLLRTQEEKQVSKDALREWYDIAWDFGVKLREINDLRIMSKDEILSESIATFGTALCQSRKDRGLLSEIQFAQY